MMKRIGLAWVIALVALLLVALPVIAKSGPEFKGAWESIDVDGSFQQLTISGNSNNLHIRYFDHMATVCGGDKAIGRGAANVEGDTISSLLEIWCLNPRRFLADSSFNAVYDPITDTLIDEYGIVWNRMGNQ
jgi:hypothetical protein